MTLKISIVIPTHNRAALVVRAVDCVLKQVREGDEVIVVDDDSKDDTQARLAPYLGRVRYEKIPHGGAGRSRNAGIELAKNPVVGFMDSDDEWLPGKLDLQRALLEARPDVLFCYSDFQRSSISGVVSRRPCGEAAEGDAFLGPAVPYSTLAPLPAGRPDFPVRIGDLYPWQLKREMVQVGTLLFRRDAAGGSERYPEDVRTMEDWEFVARLARRGKAAHLDEVLQTVYAHAGPQLLKQSELVRVDAHLKILARVWGADAAFLETERGAYEAVLERARGNRARTLLVGGSAAEARDELRRMRNPGWDLKAAAMLPGGITAALFELRRSMLRLLAAVRGDAESRYAAGSKNPGVFTSDGSPR